MLSSLTSAGQAIEQTAQSLVRVINKQSTSVVTAYYISSDTTPPGQIDLEATSIASDEFYVLANTSGLGDSFNPSITPEFENIVSITVNGTIATITTASAHNLENSDLIILDHTLSSVSTNTIDGIYSITKTGATTFTVPTTVTAEVYLGRGSWSELSLAAVSSNDENPNRIYYSKYSQPEAVPLLNYFDISAKDKEILRIIPLRDTLFVFKQDGTYRVSGQVAPFNTSLLDSSTVVVAPDSVAISNNVIYAWTSKGITPVTETGSGKEVSRPIDTRILFLSSSPFTNFSTVTWGVGYDSDSSYTIYTNI